MSDSRPDLIASQHSALILHYELRDDPDDLPILCVTLAEAERRARTRAARIGGPILIYEMRSDGECFIGTIG